MASSSWLCVDVPRPGARPLHDAQAGTLELVDLEALRTSMDQGLTEHVVALQTRRKDVHEQLDRSDPTPRAAHMLDEQQAAALAKDPLRLANRCVIVRDRAQGEAEHDGIERAIGELEPHAVADTEIDRSVKTRRR